MIVYSDVIYQRDHLPNVKYYIIVAKIIISIDVLLFTYIIILLR